MNGLKNGLYDGLLTGQANGLFDGLDNGLHNGLFNNELYLDVDAQKFINAIGILTNQQSNAINILVNQLKYYKIWNKFKAIYPFIGGTASSHKFNLINPLDTNDAYRLTFFGGWTHSSTGALPNGSNAYAETNIKANVLTQNSGHFSYYSRSNTPGGALVYKVEMGAAVVGTFTSNLILLRDNLTYAGIINSNTFIGTSTISNTQGFYVGNRNNSTIHTLWKNGKLQISGNDNSVAPTSLTIWIGARNIPAVPAATNYTDRQCAFSSIGDGLTDVDIINFNNIVQNYQRLLNRAV